MEGILATIVDLTYTACASSDLFMIACCYELCMMHALPLCPCLVHLEHKCM